MANSKQTSNMLLVSCVTWPIAANTSDFRDAIAVVLTEALQFRTIIKRSLVPLTFHVVQPYSRDAVTVGDVGIVDDITTSVRHMEQEQN